MKAYSTKTNAKTSLLMFLSMIFGFIFAWGSGFFLIHRFFTMRRDG